MRHAVSKVSAMSQAPANIRTQPVTVARHGTVAVVTIDNPPVNATSQAVRAGLMQALAQTAADHAIRAVVLHCAGRTFVAGADVAEFDAPPAAPHLPDVIAAIEGAAKPWVAALHGTVLGGGLELAMGCHARTAAPNTRLGLPEVTLGLIPGAGGSVRLPRLVAPHLALTMIAGGKPISAPDAARAGLVDMLAQGNLLQDAITFAAAMTRPNPTLARPLAGAPDDAFAQAAAQFIAKARGQISVAEAVAAVLRAYDTAADAALTAERAAFLRLKSSPQASALRQLFFAERATLNDPRCKGPVRAADMIGVVGGGTMGAGIAAACLLRGLDVTLLERDQASADAAQTRVSDILNGSAKRGLIPDVACVIARFRTAVQYSALSDRDLVIEAVFEDIAVKKDVFRQLEAHLRADAILATNTSYLDVNDIAACLANPSRAIGLHFFSPAHVMKLLEIVVPDAARDEVIATAAALAKRLGKIGVLAGVCDGFIGNRIMSAYRREADILLIEGASPSQIDAAMRDYGMAMGIYQMQDLAGLDIAWAMRKRRALSHPATAGQAGIADTLCELGRFGQKTGAGWYDYHTGQAAPSQTVAQIIAANQAAAGVTPCSFTAAQIMQRILTAFRAEAAAVLNANIAKSRDDITVVMVNGYGFPRWLQW